MRVTEVLWRFDVAIPKGSRRISLVATDASDGTKGDYADWGNAGFILLNKIGRKILNYGTLRMRRKSLGQPARKILRGPRVLPSHLFSANPANLVSLGGLHLTTKCASGKLVLTLQLETWGLKV